MRGSVRWRTAVAATAVVAVALVAAGLAVVLLLRSNLANQAELRAELTAREVAGRLAAGTSYAQLDLSDDEPIRVVDADGWVRAASEGLTEVSGAALPTLPRATPTPDDDDSDDDDDASQGEVGGGAPVFSTGTARMDGRSGEYRFAALTVKTPAGETVSVQAGADLASARDAVATVTRTMLVGLPLLLLVVAGVTWFVTRRALAPVEAIRSELAGITASRDLGRRVPVPDSRDEVAKLASTTNATLAALEASVARQRGFVADASHELRSPIASLRTQLEVGAAHPELLDVEGLVDDTIRLQDLAADLLLLARLDAGDRPADEPVRLAELVREEVERRGAARDEAQDGRTVDEDRGVRRPRRGVRVEVEVRDEPVVLGSRRRLHRVVANLLDNAERHAARTVRVVVDNVNGWAVVEVVDDGPGVPERERERIFERFVRLDDARSRDDGGAGLGLAIVRDLVHSHGGTVAVHDAPSGGASFELRLPAE